MILDVEYTIKLNTQFVFDTFADNVSGLDDGEKRRLNNWITDVGEELGEGARITAIKIERSGRLVEYSTKLIFPVGFAAIAVSKEA